MIFQKNELPLNKNVQILLLLLIISSAVSKIGMNILSPILTIYSLIFYLKNRKKLPRKLNTVFISCIALYFLGEL